MEQPAETLTWSFACPDWEDRLRACRSLLPALPLDAAKADTAVDIFNNLRLPDVTDMPTLGDAAGDWFRDIVRVVFGSLDDDGVRHVPEIFALVGKKNSKTTYSGALMLTALLVNVVPRAEFLFIGPTQEIAEVAFNQTEGMILADTEGYLQKRFHIQKHRKTIIDRVNGALVKVKTFDMKVMKRLNPPTSAMISLATRPGPRWWSPTAVRIRSPAASPTWRNSPRRFTALAFPADRRRSIPDCRRSTPAPTKRRRPTSTRKAATVMGGTGTFLIDSVT